MGAKQRRIWTAEGARGLTLEERKLSRHGGLDVLMTVGEALGEGTILSISKVTIWWEQWLRG